MAGAMANIVVTEERDALGRIVVSPLAVFLDSELADEFCQRYNVNPSTEGKTADVFEAPLMQSPTPLKARPKGSTPRSLTPQKVIEIRERYAQGATLKEVAAEFHVSYQTVSDVVRRKSWAWVLQDPPR